MEPPIGIWGTLWNFICFLPYFTGLLILGFIKAIILCPLVCLIITIANTAIILGLWPLHFFWTNYSIIRSEQFGPVLKLLLCLCISIALILWPVIGIIGSIFGGAAYGFLSPLIATFKGVEQGKRNSFYHCVYDGTVDTVEKSLTFITDFKDVCIHSYFSVMADLRRRPEDEKYHEIRLLDIPGAIVAGILGITVDFPVIFIMALFKSVYMLFKGWRRLFEDCIGREGPFLESICVPFAGLAIILWPLAVVGAVLASVLSSIFLGAYAAVIVYQESSLWLGLRYIVASLSIYDEYSNDVLDMPEGSCFPRLLYRKKDVALESTALATSLSRPDSFKNPPSRMVSIKNPMVEVKPLELLDGLLKVCQDNGEKLVREGLITVKDIEDAKSSKDKAKVISIGLPAYSLLHMLLNSAKANSPGILVDDNGTEITSTNRPKDAFFDWFLNPLLIIKDQIKAQNLTEAEEDYLRKVVLLSGDPERFNISCFAAPMASEIKRAELDAFARRLRGITKTISRYPTFKRRFDVKMNFIFEDLAKKNGNNKLGNGQQSYGRSKSAFVRMFSQKSFKTNTDNDRSNRGSQNGLERDVADIV